MALDFTLSVISLDSLDSLSPSVPINHYSFGFTVLFQILFFN